jgi:hypothetical protein
MKIKNLIAIMQKMPNQDEEIIVTWWEKEMFDGLNDQYVTNEQWENAEDEVMNMDWSDIDGMIEQTIREQQQHKEANVK